MDRVTRYNKAIIALIGAIFIILNTFTSVSIPPALMDPGTVASIAGLVTTILVYLIPNKPIKIDAGAVKVMALMIVVSVAFIPLASCSGVRDALTPKSASHTLGLAKGTYAGTVYLMTAAAKAGWLSDDVILDKLEPARKITKSAIDTAADLIRLKDPSASDYVNAALAQAQNFRLIYDTLRGQKSDGRTDGTVTLAFASGIRGRDYWRDSGRHAIRRPNRNDAGRRSAVGCRNYGCGIGMVRSGRGRASAPGSGTSRRYAVA